MTAARNGREAEDAGLHDANGNSSSVDERDGQGEPVATLACGADTDELFEQVADGRGHQLTVHQQGCVHCQAAMQEFADLWAPVTTSVATPVVVPQGFAEAVMKRVRAMAADTWYTLELTEGGNISIAARIVAQLARNAARAVPGVRVALGRSTTSKLARVVERATLGHRHPHSAVGVLGRTAVIDLALAISNGDPAHEVAQRVQQAVTAELRQNVGLKSVTVNVCVDDVLERG